MNDFGLLMNDLIIYDLDFDRWIELETKILDKEKVPPTAYASSCTVFYEARKSIPVKNLNNLPYLDPAK